MWLWLSFAETNIEISTYKTTYNIDENINIEIELKSSEKKPFELTINWLDKFAIISKRQSQNFSNINWEQNSIVKFSFLIQAPNEWKYEIWPVFTKSWNVKSNTLYIEVEWERIMINNNFSKKYSPWNTNNGDKTQDIDEIDLWNTGKKENKKIFWIYGEEMKDIYENKNFYLIIFYWIILLFLFIALLYFISKKSPLKKSIKIEKKVEKKKVIINYSKLLKEIEKKYIEEKKDIFYNKLSEVFRIFLDDKISPWLSKKSLKEAKQSIKDTYIIEIYEKIYFPEYDTINDSKNERLELLSTIKNLINK
jgi:hypothetical protein